MKFVPALCSLGAIALATALSSVEAASAGPQAGILSITFDNGYESQITNALPLLKNIRGTLFVDTQDVLGEDSPDMYTMSWSQLSKLVAAGWEIGSHSVSNPADLTSMSDDAVRAELAVSAATIAKNLGVYPVSFASPGKYNDHILSMVPPLYNEQVGTVQTAGPAIFNPTDGIDRYRVVRLLVKRDSSPVDLCQDIAWAAKEKSWLVLAINQVVPAPLTGSEGEYQVSTDNLKKIVRCISRYTADGSLKTMTVRDAMNLIPALGAKPEGLAASN